ncbi:MAG: hypothetical protein P8Y27_04960 [Chromatiaceae bacterium]
MSLIDSYVLMTTENEFVAQLNELLRKERNVPPEASTFNLVAQYAGGEKRMCGVWAYCANYQSLEVVSDAMRRVAWRWPDWVQLFWRHEGERWVEVDWKVPCRKNT